MSETLGYEIPDVDFEELASCWPELEIANSHTDTLIEIWACACGGIHYFWVFRYGDTWFEEKTGEVFEKYPQAQDLSEFVAYDRLFETRGAALDDCLDFVREKMSQEQDAWIKKYFSEESNETE